MLSSLRTRLVLICVAIVVLSMLALSVANYLTTRSSMLASADQQMQQLLHSQSAVLVQWVDGKKKSHGVRRPVGRDARSAARLPDR